jgi:hypothetical protein
MIGGDEFVVDEIVVAEIYGHCALDEDEGQDI